MMTWRILPFILLLGALLAMPGGQAQTTGATGIDSLCAEPFPIIASANNGAGFVTFCVTYPRIVLPGQVFPVVSTLFAPTTVLPVFIAAASAYTSPTGCTEGTPTTAQPTVNGVLGTEVQQYSTFTMTAEVCTFFASATLAIGTAATQYYNTGLAITVHTENLRVDNFNYLCDAPAIAPNAYVTTTTTCNDPNLALTGSLTATLAGTVALTGTLTTNLAGTIHNVIDAWPTLNVAGGLTITDDANGWNIHQDALTGTLTMNIGSWPALTVHQDAITGQIKLCGQTGVCGPIELAPILAQISGNLTVDGVNVNMGNATFPDALNVSITGELDVHQDQACGNTVPCNVNTAITNGTLGNTTGSGVTAFGVTFPVLLIIFILLLALAEWKQDAMWFILAALVGVLAVTTKEVAAPSTVLIVVAIIVYAIYRAYQAMRHFQFRDGDHESDEYEG